MESRRDITTSTERCGKQIKMRRVHALGPKKKSYSPEDGSNYWKQEPPSASALFLENQSSSCTTRCMFCKQQHQTASCHIVTNKAVIPFHSQWSIGPGKLLAITVCFGLSSQAASRCSLLGDIVFCFPEGVPNPTLLAPSNLDVDSFLLSSCP